MRATLLSGIFCALSLCLVEPVFPVEPECDGKTLIASGRTISTQSDALALDSVKELRRCNLLGMLKAEDWVRLVKSNDSALFRESLTAIETVNLPNAASLVEENAARGVDDVLLQSVLERLRLKPATPLRPPLVRKPVIYLYPAQRTNVSLRLQFAGTLTATYPQYDAAKGWEVIAESDGRLIETRTGEAYRYLFWEGMPTEALTIPEDEGFIVRGDESASFLKEKLSQMGLNADERNDFIVYWYPELKKSAFNHIYFAQKQYQDAARLEVSPKPDTMLRVFMLFRATESPKAVRPQVLPVATRRGFTLVEWGGSELEAASNPPSAKPIR